MFKNKYQSGAVVEIFSGRGKDPVAKWKLCGGPSAIYKEFDKEVKGFVYRLEGSSQTVKMQIPENGKMSLGLLQRFLVLQVNIPESKDFSIELEITDFGHLKRRLHFSTVHKKVYVTALHAKIPFVCLKHSIWASLCIDLVSFSSELFKGFLTLDAITLFATCKVRRIFTMKTKPAGMSDDDMFLNGAALMDTIPRSCQFPPDVGHVTQVLNMQHVQRADVRAGPLSSECGTPGSLQLHPPKDKPGSKKLRVHSAGRERLASPVVPSCSPVEESSGTSPKAAESLSCSTPTGLSCDLQVCSNWENNEGSEPPLTLQEEVFTFLSPPHSPKRGQCQGDQEKMEMGNGRVKSRSGRRREARPEDDFVGSESDEDKSYTTFQRRIATSLSISTPPKSPNATWDVQLEVHPNVDAQNAAEELRPSTASLRSPPSGRAEAAGVVPTRCLSPSVTSSRQEHKRGPCGGGVDEDVRGGSSVSLSKSHLQEVRLDVVAQHKVTVSKEEDDSRLKPVESSSHDFRLLGLRMHGDDDDELQMLASLKREQEEDECRASGLSVSQIHQCNISMSSDDTSTWTHVSMPANQGHHYQKEMNPLQQSNPREWMDVLSPPIMPASQQRRSDNTWNNQRNLIGGEGELVDEEENQDEYLNLLYDPCLNYYFDPKTGKYYELA